MKSVCRLCSAMNLRALHDFGRFPYGDLFQPTSEAARQLDFLPLVLARCNSCRLLQLLDETDLEVQYTNYLYFTSITNNLQSYYLSITQRLLQMVKNTRDPMIIDIGSNDGSFLKPFKEQGFEVLGVEPSRPASNYANENGITTINAFFDSNLALEIKNNYQSPSLISVNYTLANLPSLRSFIKDVSLIANSDSILSIITGYHPDQFQISMFDYIGHDHLTYLTLHDILTLLENEGWRIVDAERIEQKGGSLHVVAVRQENATLSKPSVWQILQREMWLDTKNDSLIYSMLSNIHKSISFLQDYMNSNRVEKAIGIGASISTSYLSRYFGIEESLSMLFDDDPRKIGKFAPGSGIEVSALSDISNYSNSTAVLLAWQHTRKIIDRLHELEFRGTVILPLPTPKVLEL